VCVSEGGPGVCVCLREARVCEQLSQIVSCPGTDLAPEAGGCGAQGLSLLVTHALVLREGGG
jgi:hypothetical protein